MDALMLAGSGARRRGDMSIHCRPRLEMNTMASRGRNLMSQLIHVAEVFGLATGKVPDPPGPAEHNSPMSSQENPWVTYAKKRRCNGTAMRNSCRSTTQFGALRAAIALLFAWPEAVAGNHATLGVADIGCRAKVDEDEQYSFAVALWCWPPSYASACVNRQNYSHVLRWRGRRQS
jgi:hypothetical protein